MAVKITKGVGTTLDVNLPYEIGLENHAQRVAIVLDGDAKIVFNEQLLMLGEILKELKSMNEKLDTVLD